MSEERIFERVQNDARRRMSWREARASNLYVERKVLPRDHVIKAQDQEITLERDTLMVFADDAPLANWGHPCRYLLYNAEDGELYQEVAASFPAYLIEPPETYQVFHEPVVLLRTERIWRIKPELRFVFRVPVGNRYAVLFSGASNYRHVNDLEFLCRTLVDVYNFPTNQIYVLNYDGTINFSGWPYTVGNWPGDNTAYRMTVHAQGTKSELEGVFNDLKTRLRGDDLLLIHTNNHGWYTGSDSYLSTYSGPNYYASAFSAKLAELPRFRCLMVMMEQCASGGFNAPIIASSPADRTSVASACGPFVSSWGCASGEFDCFALDWIAAVNGADPYGGALAFNPDTDGSGRVSAKEAYDYADAVKYAGDSPVYSESPTTAGSCHLGQLWAWCWWPWYRKIILERLQPYYEVVPGPVFYKRLYKELLPRVHEIDKELDQRSKELREEVQPRLEKLIKEAMEG